MENKTPEQRTREKLYKLQDKINKGKETGKIRKVYITAFAILAALVAFVVLFFAVKVKNINISGDLRAYNETRVAAASEIDIGKSVFSKSSFTIKRNIRKNIPLAEKIKVRKNIFTGDINIDISFAPFDFYIRYDDLYYAVDENLVVVDIRESENDFSSLGGTFIEIPKICKPEFSKTLVFYDTVQTHDGEEDVTLSKDELHDKSEYDYIYDVLKYYKNSRDYSDLTSVDLKVKYDIVAVYSERFKVKFGGVSSFDVKLDMLNRILADTSWQHSEYGLIDLTNPSSATAKAVQSITEDESFVPSVEPEQE